MRGARWRPWPRRARGSRDACSYSYGSFQNTKVPSLFPIPRPPRSLGPWSHRLRNTNCGGETCPWYVVGECWTCSGCGMWTCDVRLRDTRVAPLAGTPFSPTRYRGTDRRRRVIALAAPVAVGIPSPLALSRTSRRRSGEHAAVVPRVSQSTTYDNEREPPRDHSRERRAGPASRLPIASVLDDEAEAQAPRKHPRHPRRGAGAGAAARGEPEPLNVSHFPDIACCCRTSSC